MFDASASAPPPPPPPAIAEAAPQDSSAPGPFSYNLKVEVPLTLGIGSTWLVLTALEQYLMQTRCAWCEPNGLDVDARNALKWANTDTPATWSDVIAYGVFPGAIVAWEM